MKTREQIFGKDVGEILRCITSCHCIRREQLRRLFPQSSENLDKVLAYLLRQGRIFHDPGTADIFYDNAERKRDPEMLAAIWVLCDFVQRVEYHSVGEYPVKLLFFAEGELYDVIVVPQGKETLVSCAVVPREEDNKRFMVLEDIGQAEDIQIPNIAAFCIVDAETGEVQYYAMEE